MSMNWARAPDSRKDADQLNAATQRIGGGMTALAASIGYAALGLGRCSAFGRSSRPPTPWTNLQNRLRLVTSTQAQLAAVTDDVYRIAQLTSPRWTPPPPSTSVSRRTPTG